MLTSTITQKGQITIPKKIRDALQIKTHDTVVLVKRGEDIIIKPLKNILSIRGAVKVDHEQDYTKIRKEIRDEVTDRIAHE
jgi:AbrB family looped-hinge helix DNA binding protein